VSSTGSMETAGSELRQTLYGRWGMTAAKASDVFSRRGGSSSGRIRRKQGRMALVPLGETVYRYVTKTPKWTFLSTPRISNLLGGAWRNL
jgi:hypothetical protein